MFTAALFTIAKTWKQPKCPLTEERTKKIHLRISNELPLSHRKKRNGPPEEMQMELETVKQREMSQKVALEQNQRQSGIIVCVSLELEFPSVDAAPWLALPMLLLRQVTVYSTPFIRREIGALCTMSGRSLGARATSFTTP